MILNGHLKIAQIFFKEIAGSKNDTLSTNVNLTTSFCFKHNCRVIYTFLTEMWFSSLASDDKVTKRHDILKFFNLIEEIFLRTCLVKTHVWA